MKVLFLDVDGVLNKVSDWVWDDENASPSDSELAREFAESFPDYEGSWARCLSTIDAALVERLNTIVRASGAKVVLSSAWRRWHSLPEMRALLKARGFVGELISATPRRLPSAKMSEWVSRGSEIAWWLENEAPEPVERFVILDDNDGMDGMQKQFVQTDCEVGLSDADVAKALEILEAV